MATALLPPTVQRLFDDLRRRVEILERRRRTDDSIVAGEIVFTLPGAVTTSESPNFYLRDGGYVTAMVCSLQTAGTTTTTVVLKQDGATVATATLASGVTFSRITPRARYGADTEAMSVAVSGAGTGAKDLSVQIRY